MVLNVDYRVDGSDFVVESTYDPAGVATIDVDYQTTVFPTGESRNSLTDEETITVNLGSISRTSRFDLGGLGVSPGETADLSVTTVYTRATAQGPEAEQEQNTVEVTRGGGGGSGGEPSLDDVELTCRGIRPQNPAPGDQMEIDYNVDYSGPVAFPTVRIRPTIGGVRAGEVNRTVAEVGESSFFTNVPTTLSPGETVEVSLEVIDIER